MLSLVEMRNIARSVAPTIDAHWRRLNFRSREEYEYWRGCGLLPPAPNTFQVKLDEACRRYLELEKDQRQARHFQSAEQLISAICTGRLKHWEVSHAPLQVVVELIQDARFDEHEAASLARFLGAVTRHGPLMVMSVPEVRGVPAIQGLIGLHDYRAYWVRDVDAWAPPGGGAEDVFASLVRHLFDRFGDVPVFMDRVWLRRDADGEAYRAAYVRLGRGGSLREAGLPAPLTRRMLHGLRGAPAAYPVEAAVRWAQARAFGADAAAAEAIVATPLGRDLGDWDYWEPFVRLVSRARSVPLHQIGPLADFVRLRRLNGEGAVSFRGRTGASLLQMMEDWHRDLHRRQTPFVRFAKARINEVAFELEFEGVTAGWRFLRLQDSHALAEEGRLMRHCVASRTHACRSGRHSVWRAVRTLEGREEHCLTLEVTRQGVPVEVRGLANRWPAPAESAAVNLFLRRLGEAAADTAGKAP